MSRVDAFGESWSGRRVTVVGLGRSGLAAARLLLRAGALVSLTESRDTSDLRSAIDALPEPGPRRVELGGHTSGMLSDAELVVTSPGVADAGGPIAWAESRRLPILSEIEVAFRFCASPVVAVTGTNGKSTAVTLIEQAARAAGRHAVACGNLGTPFSSIIDTLLPETLVVIEISSFQLLRCDRFRPKIGVLLNLSQNHLDRHGSPAAYLAAKARLFRRQSAEDWAVLNGADPAIVALGERVKARRVWFGDNRTNPPALRLSPATCRALGANLQAVLQVCRLLKIPDPLAWQVMRSFRGLEHRLEHAGTVRGIHFVNDSKSTTPDSTLHALAHTPGNVVLIIGGRDKNMAFGPLFERLHEARVQGVVLMGESRGRLRPLLNGSTRVREGATLDEAMQAALGLAGPGSTVLFSPACASFDLFRNFEERGRAFKYLVDEFAEGYGQRAVSKYPQPPAPSPELPAVS
jgi:UDP-N-acetylmuramoylalanine--D-glutamate ligase